MNDTCLSVLHSLKEKRQPNKNMHICLTFWLIFHNLGRIFLLGCLPRSPFYLRLPFLLGRLFSLVAFFSWSPFLLGWLPWSPFFPWSPFLLGCLFSLVAFFPWLSFLGRLALVAFFPWFPFPWSPFFLELHTLWKINLFVNCIVQLKHKSDACLNALRSIIFLIVYKLYIFYFLVAFL